MVTEAGKELLRNTINTAKFHNKILEENEMWKQFELERGLTMMVSDDDILKRIKKHHQCSKHRKRDRSKEERYEKSEPKASSSKEDSDKWDHSGFHELYPDEKRAAHTVPTAELHSKKWDHGGFHELYPDEKPAADSVQTAKLLHKKQKKKKQHSSESSNSDNEIWEDFKKFKKAEKLKQKSKQLSIGSSSGFDNHVKEWKKYAKRMKSNSSYS